jgi:hypothetical protein
LLANSLKTYELHLEAASDEIKLIFFFVLLFTLPFHNKSALNLISFFITFISVSLTHSAVGILSMIFFCSTVTSHSISSKSDVTQVLRRGEQKERMKK